MKVTDFVLRLTAFVLALASLACLVMANLEEITACLNRLGAKVREKKSSLCGCCCQAQEWDDELEDWDV